jgi:hypothetical protein
MNISDRLVGVSLGEGVEQFDEARVVRIAHRGFAIWLNPVGMLNAQVVVNLLPEFGVVMDLVRHGNWLGEDSSVGRARRPALAR